MGVHQVGGVQSKTWTRCSTSKPPQPERPGVWKCGLARYASHPPGGQWISLAYNCTAEPASWLQRSALACYVAHRLASVASQPTECRLQPMWTNRNCRETHFGPSFSAPLKAYGSPGFGVWDESSQQKNWRNRKRDVCVFSASNVSWPLN